MPPIDKKHAAVVAIPVLLIAAAYLFAPPSFWEGKDETNAAASPDEQLNRMFDRDLAAAKAEAEAKAAAREQELNATEAALNAISGDNDLLAQEDPLAGLNVAAPPPGTDLPGTLPTTVRPEVPDGYVLSKDGELVNVNALVDSVRAARSEGK